MYERIFGFCVAIALAYAPASALPADIAAGKAISTAQCIECHEADDWHGESAADLEALIKDIVAGKVRHKKKLSLSAGEIANIAAYWGEASK